MNIKKLTVTAADFPEQLRQIPEPPGQLFHAGAPLEELLKRPRVAIVGSRRISTYGRKATQQLAGELAEQGIVIVSGLALGVDAVAHQAALEAGGLCLAVLPGPLEKIVPATNHALADKILASGGALVSEYAVDDVIQKHYFIVRNRLVSGLADAVLITEAGEKSGTLHTARFALEQGKDVLAVPGDIYSPGCKGTNNLLRRGHAAPVTSYQDVLHALGLEVPKAAARRVKGRNASEQTLLDLLTQGITDGDELLTRSQLTTSEFNQVLTMLEISSKIRPLGANHWAIA